MREAGMLRSATLPPTTMAAMLAHPQALALEIDLAPVVAGDGITGWRIARLAPSGTLAGLGLREHDVVVAVDGTPADAPASFAAALRAVAGAHTFTLDVLRDARLLTFQFFVPPTTQH